ncbi:unnamed protein product [Callosobruchus maculatus]|nr:unnamed protein product [Callosobruchus maculatus]
MYLTATVILSLLPILNSQYIHFPTDQENEAFSSTADLAALRGTPEYGMQIEQIISTGNTKLALAVNKALLQQASRENDNIVFAPVSVTVALALVLLGAKGKTFEEVSNVMGLAAGVDIQGKSLVVHEHLNNILKKLTKTTDSNQKLTIASAIFVQNDYPIRSLYKQTAKNIYKSEVLNVDFKHDVNKATQLMNAWVSERTEGKITSVLSEPPIDTTKVIIASALYFKALWEHPFFDGMTARKPFYTNGRNAPATMEVEMMANGGFFPYYKDPNLKCEILGLPYRGNETTMYVIVPSSSSAARLKEFESSLTQENVDRLADSTVSTGVVMLFPKMKIDTTINLKEVLKTLGLRSLFSPSEANLALLSPGEAMADAPSRASLALQAAKANPIAPEYDRRDVLVFSRSGFPENCSKIFDKNSTEKMCETTDGSKKVLYKKFGDKVGRRVAKRDTLDIVRRIVDEQSSENFHNPGLYADQVIHKVYMDITETGTEAAASTSISLSRDGSRLTFRVDVPFLFFIRHELTKTVLFWGSVTEPTPNFPRS